MLATRLKKEKQKQQIKAILLLGFVVFLSLSFYSYHPLDPSLNSFGLSLKVKNYCGFIGASFADLFYQIFGLSSWLVILALSLLSFQMLRGIKGKSLSFHSFLFFLLLITSASFSELHLGDIKAFDGNVSLGGALGMGVITVLKPFFHTIGTSLLLLLCFFVTLMLLSQTLFSTTFFYLPKQFLLYSYLGLKKSKPVFVFSLKVLKSFPFYVFSFFLVSFQFIFHSIKKINLRKLNPRKFLNLKKSVSYLNFLKRKKLLNKEEDQTVTLTEEPLRASSPEEELEEEGGGRRYGGRGDGRGRRGDGRRSGRGRRGS